MLVLCSKPNCHNYVERKRVRNATCFDCRTSYKRALAQQHRDNKKHPRVYLTMGVWIPSPEGAIRVEPLRRKPPMVQ